MSNRTLVELNHDYCPEADEVELRDWANAMAMYMHSGDKSFLPDGVTFKHMRHHSEPDPIGPSPAQGTPEPPTPPASTARTDGWVSVEERLPEDSEIVLLFQRDGIASVTTFGVRDKGKWLDYNNTTDDYPNEIRKITHWQPLPAAPGSVPQAPDSPKKPHCPNCGCNHFRGENTLCNDGVPQAEPPKEEKS